MCPAASSFAVVSSCVICSLVSATFPSRFLVGFVGFGLLRLAPLAARLLHLSAALRPLRRLLGGVFRFELP